MIELETPLFKLFFQLLSFHFSTEFSFLVRGFLRGPCLYSFQRRVRVSAKRRTPSRKSDSLAMA
jgi:hypothetical protein